MADRLLGNDRGYWGKSFETFKGYVEPSTELG